MKASILVSLAFILAVGAAHAEDEENGCTAAAPEALLDAKAYKDHSFQKDKTVENAAHESATLPGGGKLKIDFNGCADGAAKVFLFSLKKEGHAVTDLAYWAGRADKELTALSLTKDAAYIRKELSKFLKRAPKLPNSAKAGIAVSECMDESKPTQDGCDFTHMGMDELKVTGSGESVTLELTYAASL